MNLDWLRPDGLSEAHLNRFTAHHSDQLDLYTEESAFPSRPSEIQSPFHPIYWPVQHQPPETQRSTQAAGVTGLQAAGLGGRVGEPPEYPHCSTLKG